MKKIILLLFITTVSLTSFSQTFTFAAVMAIPDNGPQTCQSQAIAGLGSILDCGPFGLESVCIRINHSWDSDLDIFLTAPDGTSIELSTDNGGSGNNYGSGATLTCFSMTAGTNITAGTAPFTAGPYFPEGPLSNINNGQNGNGIWQICITDDAGGDVGSLLGWSLTFGNSSSCPPPPTAQNCDGGVTVCNSTAFSGNASGFSTQELNAGNSDCLSVEHNSSWYFFETSAAGNLAFTVSPQNGTDDYDFAVWGPYPTGSTPAGICPPVGVPIRCSYASGGGNTGLLNGSGDNTENSLGDQFVEDINAGINEVYILLVDNFTSAGSPFDLNWSLSGGASLDCTPLSVKLIDFSGISEGNINHLTWSTSSEINNNFFKVQRSEDGINFYNIGSVNSAGNSNTIENYMFNDLEISSNYYYRLKQVDYNGSYEFSNVIFLKSKAIDKIKVYPNPSKGKLFIRFDNNSNNDFVWIKYIDILGKSSNKELIRLREGDNKYETNLFKDLVSGIYFIQIISNNHKIIHTQKIVKE